MQITDLQGMVIAVTDLDASIAMVKAFISYTHIDAYESLTRFEQQRLIYWKDVYEKLLQLKAADGANQIIDGFKT